MELNPVDGGKLMVLMVAGGVFALAGLWMVLRPKDEGSGARIEIFGLKFESSSAGLLIFIVGAAFLALPLFLPEKRQVPPADGEGGAGLAPAPQPVGELGDIVLPRRASGEETEPNDGISDSIQFALGETVEGTLSPDDEDWWVFSVPPDVEQFRVTFRNLGDGCPQFFLFDTLEQKVFSQQVCSSAVSDTRLVWNENGPYYLRVIANNARTSYQLLTASAE